MEARGRNRAGSRPRGARRAHPLDAGSQKHPHDGGAHREVAHRAQGKPHQRREFQDHGTVRSGIPHRGLSPSRRIGRQRGGGPHAVRGGAVQNVAAREGQPQRNRGQGIHRQLRRVHAGRRTAPRLSPLVVAHLPLPAVGDRNPRRAGDGGRDHGHRYRFPVRPQGRVRRRRSGAQSDSGRRLAHRALVRPRDLHGLPLLRAVAVRRRYARAVLWFPCFKAATRVSCETPSTCSTTRGRATAAP